MAQTATASPLLHRDIKTDYLSGAAPLRPFYQYPLRDTPFEEVITDKAFPLARREALHQALKDQYQGYALSPALTQNLEKLREEGTYTLTTGHQLGLMGGPLFTTYKVMSTIWLAEHLQGTYPDRHFVPVFWIHTEDHDFEEINHYYTAFGQKHTYKGTFQSATGLHVLEDSIREIIPAHWPDELKACWEPGQTLAQAYRRFYHALMNQYGLVILDASHPSLKAQFTEVLKGEVEGAHAFHKVNLTSDHLADAGYKRQIHPREINLFYLDAEGRNRIDIEGDHFHALERNLQWTRSELLSLMQAEPEKFSPNVSLRPLYQEMILPNLAYFGGWGELSYWLQLKGIFDQFKENFPAVLPRFSATVWTPEMAKQWESLGFHLSDIRRPLHRLYDTYMPNVWEDDTFRALEQEIHEKLETMRQYIESDISPTLARSAAALKVKSEKYLSRIHHKAYKVKRNRFPEAFRKIEETKVHINPDGAVQERVWSLASLESMTPFEFVDFIYQQKKALSLDHHHLVLPS
ncbi:MAG: bacillithiol biosynthesis cysteine-adding enzyme BshC [Bacteroidota bacterium]